MIEIFGTLIIAILLFPLVLCLREIGDLLSAYITAWRKIWNYIIPKAKEEWNVRNQRINYVKASSKIRYHLMTLLDTEGIIRDFKFDLNNSWVSFKRKPTLVEFEDLKGQLLDLNQVRLLSTGFQIVGVSEPILNEDGFYYSMVQLASIEQVQNARYDTERYEQSKTSEVDSVESELN